MLEAVPAFVGLDAFEDAASFRQSFFRFRTSAFRSQRLNLANTARPAGSGLQRESRGSVPLSLIAQHTASLLLQPGLSMTAISPISGAGAGTSSTQVRNVSSLMGRRRRRDDDPVTAQASDLGRRFPMAEEVNPCALRSLGSAHYWSRHREERSFSHALLELIRFAVRGQGAGFPEFQLLLNNSLERTLIHRHDVSPTNIHHKRFGFRVAGNVQAFRDHSG